MTNTMYYTILIISGLVSTSIASFWIALRNLRKTPSIRSRFAQYVDIPMTADEMELQLPLRERVIKPALHNILQTLGRLGPSGNMEEIAHKLIIAGHPAGLSPIDFLGLKLLSGVIVGILVTIILLSRQTQTLSAILFGISGLLAGQFLPDMWLRNLIKHRKQAVIKLLPDAMDMLTICVDAGLGFDAALLKVAERWDNPLTEEFARVVSEIRMGIRRADAMRHMAERLDVPEVHAFVAVLIQADRLGVSIADILHTQSEQLRTRRRQLAEEQARKAPIKMLFPLILFIFPALFAVILGPAVPRFLEAFGAM
ncbi:MAG: type II secretion system F family protein [Anaerolineae bacterium]|nr:type II secretion system F family protein [Anaerolineae bacterium]